MDRYPYVEHNLFHHPESYEYATCDSDAYLDLWRHARDAARRALAARLATALESPPSEQDGATVREDSTVPLSDIARRLVRQLRVTGALSDENKRIADKLVAKLEIFHRLFDAYDATMRRAADAQPANVRDYLLVGGLLARLAETTRSAKYLSTLLKLTDALCALPARSLTVSDARSLCELLDNEQALVGHWEAEVAA